jgi:hypothetical protein
MILISVSALITLPVTYFFAGKWIVNFYYKIKPGVLSFVVRLTIALFIDFPSLQLTCSGSREYPA